MYSRVQYTVTQGTVLSIKEGTAFCSKRQYQDNIRRHSETAFGTVISWNRAGPC